MNFIKILVGVIKTAIHKELYSDPKLAVSLYRKKGVKIGENTELYNAEIDSLRPFLVTIGNNVLITGTRILTHDASTKKFIGYTKVGKVSIGDNVFVGVGTIILPNTHIGNNVIIGAGTIVAKDVPDNTIVVGNPMRVIGTVEDYKNRNLEMLRSASKFEQNYHMTDIEIENMNVLLGEGIGFIKCR